VDGAGERAGPADGGRRAALGFGTRGATWFDAVERFLDAAIERDEEVVCTFEGFEADVPVGWSADAPAARWRLDGTVAVRVEGTRGPLAEWLSWWSSRMA
jgi:hypothetical protein